MSRRDLKFCFTSAFLAILSTHSFTLVPKIFDSKIIAQTTEFRHERFVELRLSFFTVMSMLGSKEGRL
jgi:hypothetical protein